MKEKIKEIREELVANIFKMRKDVELKLQETWVLDSEGGIVQAIKAMNKVLAYSQAIKEDLITLFWLNKLLMVENERED